jgi:hypothetical protein
MTGRVTAGCFYVDGSGATAVPGSIGWSSTWSLPCGGAGTGAGGFGFCLSDMLKWYRLTNLRALLRVTPPPLDNPLSLPVEERALASVSRPAGRVCGVWRRLTLVLHSFGLGELFTIGS